MPYLSTAIATICTQLDGLLFVQLPSGLSDDFAHELVRAANSLLQTQPPFAILIGEAQDVADPLLPVVSRRNAIMYRRDRRLAVVQGAGVDLASFDNSYRRVVGPGFPFQSTDRLSLDALAPILVEELLHRTHLAADASVHELCSAQLSLSMRVLSDCYARAKDTTRGWNGLWFEHVEHGMSSLEHVLQRLSASGGSTPIGEAFTKFVWPCMGLPQEAGSKGWSSGRAPKEFMDGLGEHWSDVQSIRLSCAQLREVIDKPDWTELPWELFAEERIARESTLGALQSVVTRPESLLQWAEMDRMRFESPIATSRPLKVQDLEGRPLEVKGEGSPAIVRLDQATADWRTDDFEVVIPAHGDLSEEDLLDLDLSMSLTAVQFVTTERRTETGAAVIRGHVAISSRPNLKPVTARVSVEVTPGSPAAGRIAAKAQANLLVVRSDFGAVAWPMRANLGKGVYCGPETIEEQRDASVFSQELTTKAEHLVVVWGDVSDLKGISQGRDPMPGLYTARIPSEGGLEISASGCDLAYVGMTTRTGFVTPLTAAPSKSTVDLRALGDEVAGSVRGRMEEHLTPERAHRLIDVLGHCVVPAGHALDGSFESDEAVGVAGISNYPTVWQTQTGLSVPPTVRDSEAAEEFRLAALALMQGLGPGDDGSWPSRLSWAHLIGGPVLDRYLNAYADLVDVNRDGERMERFWAAYPFSASVWSGQRCEAVLLSPLHPVRLAWLASAERILFDADEAPALAGTVEGWQFPSIGPSPTPNGRMLAIPSDSGPGNVFAAWSMMVPVSPDDNAELRAPARILGQNAPGTSPSGLTASAAEAALRDFLRANAHVPSLTIDLAAGTDTARLEEVDNAVLATLHSLDRQGGRRGVRVLDSVHRTGDLPRDALKDAMRRSSHAPTLTWSRYRPGAQGASPRRRSNIRLLQDSGAQLRTRPAAQGSELPDQVAAELPLRRFQAGDVVVHGEGFRSARLAPTGWSAFDAALSSLEGGGDHFEIGVRLAHSYLVDKAADWTVSGEAFLSAGAISALVSQPGIGAVGGEQVLWEWKPPYLQGTQGGAIERRPYVTVARVSPALRANLGRKVGDITGWTGGALDQSVSDILMRLGTEGLGLSSLLTRGGTHETGALGFYLAYRLLREAQPRGVTDVVLPIDACDTFLTALGGTRSLDRTKRADLLLLRFDGPEVVLVPIEIKFFGATGATSARLPAPGPALKEALSQLNETAASLKRLIARSSEVRGADRSLWFSAFTTLVESGLQLGAGTSRTPPSPLIVDLLSGRTSLRLGHPLVMYFDHSPDDDDYQCHTDQGTEGHQYGAFIARPRTIFQTLATDETDLAEPIRMLLSWSTSAGMEEPRARPPGGARGTTAAEVGEEHSASRTAVIPPTRGDARPPDEGGATTSTEPMEADPITEPARAGASKRGLSGQGVKFSVGQFLGSVGRGVPEYWPSNTELNQLNIGVVGDLGTGKTQLLQGLVLNLRREAARAQANPVSFLILDYKRDFQKPEFLEAVGGVVLSPHDIPFNPFQLRGEYSKLRAYERAKDFCDILERIYRGVGPVQRQRLTTAILDAYAARRGEAPVLGQILDLYQEGGIVDSVTSILRDFVMREVFVEDRGPTVQFDALLDDRVVVLALNELGTAQNDKNALVALFLNEYYSYMLTRTKWPFTGADPSLRRLNSYLLVDEAVNIMRYDFEVLENLLLQGREFGVGVVLSSQFLSHFQTARTNWAQPLLTWFIHKVPHVSAKDLEKVGLGGAGDLVSQITDLRVHETLYKSLGVPGRLIRGNPFFELIADSSQ